MSLSVRTPQVPAADVTALALAQTSSADPAAKPQDATASKGLAGRAVKQVLHMAAHAAVLAAKGLWKLGEGVVFVARKFGQLTQSLHQEYKRQEAAKDKHLSQRTASRPFVESAGRAATSSSTASAGQAQPEGPGADARKPAPSDTDRLASKARREDALLAQAVRQLPNPPTGVGPTQKSSGGSRAFTDFEHSGSTLSGKPLDPKWQQEVDALQRRLDDLKRPNGP
jgi:hypothetical protein